MGSLGTRLVPRLVCGEVACVRHQTHLCLSPPPDPRGDFDPPAGRPPAPTDVLEADLWEGKETGTSTRMGQALLTAVGQG